MSLRGVKPTEIVKRCKLFIYGPAGSWKTTTAISFPKPYLIDTEKGAENSSYIQALSNGGGAYFFTASFGEVLEEVKALLTEHHKYQTLIVDPFTVIYNDQVDAAADEHGTEFGRHRAVADRKIRQLLNLLLRLDMNVVITSHQKPQWERVTTNGKTEVREVGKTFDAYPKLDYVFDLVLEIQRRGKDHVAIIQKSRITAFPIGDVFQLSYDEIANRYGRGELERDAVPVELATHDQVKQITHLVGVLKISDEITSKWLKKAEADSFDELPRVAAGKCLIWLTDRLDPDNKEE